MNSIFRQIANQISSHIEYKDYPMALLAEADEMIKRGKHEVAVVTAQMACEVCVERVISKYLKSRELGSLEAWILDSLSSYSLSNNRVAALYKSLTNNDISKEFFWQDYKAAISIRNKAVHAGARVQESQSQMVCKISKLVIKHLIRIEERASD